MNLTREEETGERDYAVVRLESIAFVLVGKGVNRRYGSEDIFVFIQTIIKFPATLRSGHLYNRPHRQPFENRC